MRAAIVTAVVVLCMGVVPDPGDATSSDPRPSARRPVGGSGAASGDFDDDGFGDLAIGIPGEDAGAIFDSGAVQIIYGSTTGLSGAGNQLFSQASPGLGATEDGDRFGASLSSGDFDGDGNADLAVGAPGDDVNGITDAGQVQVLFGTDDGLVTAGVQTFSGNEPNDRFGTVLAWADFGRGAQGDLAVGVPDEDIDGLFDAGEVQVLYGSATGLQGASRQVINQKKAALAPLEARDRFGASLAAGDVGKNGLADLAIGAPVEDVGAVVDAGAVQVVYGSADGLKLGVATLVQDLQPEENDQFGFAMATGNFNGTGKKDLAIGVPLEDVFLFDHGAVAIAFGGATGIAPVTRLIAENAPSDGIGTGDQFGRALAAADFDLDGITDLAVGIPLEDFEPPGDDDPQTDTGSVLVFLGVADGRPRPVQVLFEVFKQSSDKFGVALSAWDFGEGPAPDLVVGVPFDNPFNLLGKTTNDAGSVQVFPSSGSSTAPFSSSQRDFFVQDGLTLPDDGEPGDQFGGAVY